MRYVPCTLLADNSDQMSKSLDAAIVAAFALSPLIVMALLLICLLTYRGIFGCAVITSFAIVTSVLCSALSWLTAIVWCAHQ